MAAAPQRRRKVSQSVGGILGGVAIALLAVVWALGPWNTHSDEARLVRFDIEAPAGTALRMPAETALSPDGKHFLSVAVGTTEDVTTFAASLDGGPPEEITRTGSMER